MNDQDMYDRNRKGSLYSMGYSNGYENKKFDPHWCPDGDCMKDKIMVTLESDIEEYKQGYEDGKFHFSIDSKKLES